MHKIWKTIKEVKCDNMRECVELLRKKNYIVSHWIADIAKKSETNIKDIKFPIELIRVKVLKGEWLRIAVPLDSMIDSDGIPHLPKLGQGLNLLFIETYWSYPGAVFHPHNDFLVQKK